MNIKDRLTSYEPLFQHYYVEEVIDSHDNETIIRVKKDDYLQSVAYVKIISIYGHDLPVEELESQAKEMKESMLNSDHYEDDEQYLIEDNQANIIGIDLCILLDQEKYDEEMFESQDFSRLYDIGLYYYDNHDYIKALEYFKQGELVDDPDCLCIIGYMYERGFGLPQDFQLAAKYYRKATDLGSAVASCNLAYFYETGSGVEQDYIVAYHFYSLGLPV